MRLSSVAAVDQKLTRTIVWSSGTNQNVMLAVTLEYIPPDTLRSDQEQRRTQIIAKRKLVPMEDSREISNAMERIWHEILASAVQNITLPGGGAVTLGEMKSLFSLSPDQVKKAGGLGTPVLFDPSDQTPITDDERKDSGYEQALKTRGDVAKQNILYLIRVSALFRQFVETIIADVSYFQDADWESQLKNS